MQYNSKRAADSVKIVDEQFLGAGVHDNAVFAGVRLAVSPNKGISFLEFSFEKNGDTFKHTEWPIDDSNGASEEDLEKRHNQQLSRIEQIVNAVFDNGEKQEFGNGGWKELSNWVVTTMTPQVGTKVRIKIIYTPKGYLSLPRYAKFSFIENQHISDTTGKKKVAVLGIDDFTKPVIKDNEQPKSNPFNTHVTSTNDSNFPF
jgi:hypothetical protein